ncbi:hypothetical protein PSEUDO8BK_80002 [Pseudomonas sp. 8BK]|uniref:hypothetical protein n=1 Tax=Pseudomonas sp. 8BK TaxID=2653164 RepID=UPI0012F00010|nr:hypothetical protein [Pseudomonas sp. 8BK]VXC38551.1 hypothetical protein PSEUDO8BK_80002 [Pseudomonas sp. 8BK]
METFDEQHLSMMLSRDVAKAEFREIDLDGARGFILVIEGNRRRLAVLRTQRGPWRLFKDLGRAASLLRERGVNQFTVKLLTADAEKPEGDVAPYKDLF